MMLSGMTKKELDGALVRADPRLRDYEDEAVQKAAWDRFEPHNDLELEAIKSALYGGYHDPHNHEINTRYVDKTFAQALLGTPDALKENFLSQGIDRATGRGFTPHTHRTWRPDLVHDKVQDYIQRHNGVLFGGGVEKDILTASVTGNTGGGVLINQQVTPQLALWYYNEFKALTRISRVPALGLDYEWNNELSVGGDDDLFLDDNGCPPITNSVYYRGRTNIALVGVQRGVNLRLELAVRAGGVLYNGGMGPYELAMKGAITQRARLLEMDWFQGTTLGGHSDPLASEYGKTFLNGVNGWRVLLSGHANEAHSDFYPAGFAPLIYEQDMTSPGTIASAICQGAIDIRNRGGRPTAVYCSFDVANRLRGEVTNFIRYIPDNGGSPWGTGAPAAGSDLMGGGITVGAHVAAIDTPVGLLPIIACPDSSVGKYAVSSIGTPTINGITLPATQLTSTYCQDVIIASEDDLVFPYYGSPEPMPIEIPYGIGTFDNGLGQTVGCFNRRFIVYLFWGFGVLVPIHQAKVRVPAPDD